MLIPQIQPKTGDVLKDASKTLTPARTGYTFELKLRNERACNSHMGLQALNVGIVY